MKKILLLAAFAFLTSFGYSQTISYGIDAGLNITKIPFEENAALASLSAFSIPVSNGYVSGFHVGVLMDIKFKSFSIQPGALFTTKGGYLSTEEKSPETTSSFILKSKMILNYIEVPVNVLYRIPVGKGNIFFGGGPYIGFGLSGRGEIEPNPAVQISGEPLKYDFGGNNLKSPDLGINALIGYQLNSGPTISAGYGHGFVNTLAIGTNGKNQGFSFSLAYFIK